MCLSHIRMHALDTCDVGACAGDPKCRCVADTDLAARGPAADEHTADGNIKLKVCSEDGTSLTFLCPKGARLQRLMDLYCTRRNISGLDLVFSAFNGRQLVQADRHCKQPGHRQPG